MQFDRSLALRLIAAPKSFVPGTWQRLNPAQQLTVDFTSSVAVVDDLSMKIHVHAGTEERANFTLLMRQRGRKQRFRIYSLDWNSPTPHQNPFRPSSPHSFKKFLPGETHEHHCQYMEGDENPDHFAAPVDIDLPDFETALSYFCVRMNIQRPPDLPPLLDQRSLL